MTDEKPEYTRESAWGVDDEGVFLRTRCPHCDKHSITRTLRANKFTEESMKEKSLWVQGDYKILTGDLKYEKLSDGKIRVSDYDKLEVGSGFHPEPEFLHMDMNMDAPHIEVWGNVKEMPFADENFSEFRAIHVIEHIWWADLFWTFAEINRVLKPGGIVTIEVPDLEAALDRDVSFVYHFNMALYAEFKTEEDYCYYANAPLYLMHHSVFSYPQLKWYLEQAGFGDIMRDKAREKISQHHWLGVLAVKATKIGKPKPSKEISSDYWIGVRPDYPYHGRYVEKWG